MAAVPREDHEVEDGEICGLSFSGQALKLNTYEDANVITEKINSCSKLISLDLDGNTIGVEAAQAIGESLESHPEFTQAIWKNMFTGRTKEEIPDALNYLGGGIIRAGAHLQILDLSDNAFGPIGVEGLRELLKSECCFSLQELKLNNNGLGIYGGGMLAEGLTECYKASNGKFALKVFIAGRNRLENKGARALAHFFRLVKTLEVVAVPQNGIYHEGIAALSEAFSYNPNLKEINMNDNTLSEKGAKELAEAVSQLEFLEVLNVGDCLIKTRGATYIAEALAEGHELLRELYVDHNEIRIDGGLALASAMSNKPNLKVVNMNGNAFGESGVEMIQEHMGVIENYSEILGSFSEDEECSDSEPEEEASKSYSVTDDESQSDAEDSDYVVISESEEIQVRLNSETESDSYVIVNDVSHPKSSPLAAWSQSKTNPFAEFLDEPTVDNFVRLDSRYQTNIDILTKNCDSDNFDQVLIDLLLKVSSLYEANEDIRHAVVVCSEALYKTFFDWAEKQKKKNDVVDAICSNLRLIKSENEDSLHDCNAESCCSVLEKVLQSNAIPESERAILSFVFERRRT